VGIQSHLSALENLLGGGGTKIQFFQRSGKFSPIMVGRWRKFCDFKPLLKQP